MYKAIRSDCNGHHSAIKQRRFGDHAARPPMALNRPHGPPRPTAAILRKAEELSRFVCYPQDCGRDMLIASLSGIDPLLKFCPSRNVKLGLRRHPGFMSRTAIGRRTAQARFGSISNAGSGDATARASVVPADHDTERPRPVALDRSIRVCL